MKGVRDNILETIGNTPIVRLNHVVPKGKHNFFGKIEYFNPGQSVKDRVAKYIIEEAERRGELKPGATIIEATSGNTGLGLAIAACIKGYKTIFVMPDKVSEEKRSILRAYGAKVVVTPTAVEPSDARSYYSVAKKLVEITPNCFYSNQYHNQDNTLAHYKSTGPEIWEQMSGKVDVVVAGGGTGGTVTGVSKFLKEKNKNIKMVVIDPIGSILFDLYYYKEVRTPAHSYKVEGVGEDFLPTVWDFNYVDAFLRMDDKRSFVMCRELVAKEGICVGPSSGMALAGAIEYSEKLEKPSNILVILPDHGKSYLSKAFNDAWLRDNGFLPSPLTERTVGNLIALRAKDHDVISCKVDQTVMDVVTTLKKVGISQVPIFSDDTLVGIIDESDLLEPLASGKIKPQDPIIHLIKGNIVWVEWDETLQQLAEHFKQGMVALVKNQQGKMRIVTKIDLLEYMGQHL
ncbi:MAG: pyridoxal-phosphate dependent enzyme [Pseudomonadota bacterium]|nr:pyridoxal-phosphate dependent enzyme [Pseudomonadota bacterium]